VASNAAARWESRFLGDNMPVMTASIAVFAPFIRPFNLVSADAMGAWFPAWHQVAKDAGTASVTIAKSIHADRFQGGFGQHYEIKFGHKRFLKTRPADLAR